MSKELYFNCYLSHFIVSDVSGFLIRRQNRPNILSAGEEVNWYKNCVQYLVYFVTLGCMEHHLSCTHRVFFSSEYGVKFLVVPDFFFFFFYNFCIFSKFLFQTILKISQNLLVFLEKAMKKCFVANLPSFQENFNL